MYYLRDPLVQISVNFYLKLSLTALFTHLKIILLQCFQFSAISGIQTDPEWIEKISSKLVVVFLTNTM